MPRKIMRKKIRANSRSVLVAQWCFTVSRLKCKGSFYQRVIAAIFLLSAAVARASPTDWTCSMDGVPGSYSTLTVDLERRTVVFLGWGDPYSVTTVRGRYVTFFRPANDGIGGEVFTLDTVRGKVMGGIVGMVCRAGDCANTRALTLATSEWTCVQK